MKYLFIILPVLLITGCEKPVSEWKTNVNTLDKISELEDCKRIEVNTGERKEVVYRCSLSVTSTNYTCGKGCTAHNILIDNSFSSIDNTEKKVNNINQEKINELKTQISKLNDELNSIKAGTTNE